MATFSQVQSDMKYKQAKGSLLAIILFSFINLFALTFTDSYYLFSSYITQLFGIMAWVALEEASTALVAIFIIIGALTLIPYLLCFIFAKKRVGWMIAALVLFSIDTLLLIIMELPYIAESGITIIIDLVFHAYGIFALATAVKYGLQAKKIKESPVEPAPITEENAELTLERRTVVIEREKRFVGCSAVFTCYIDGTEVCKIKNGQTTEISIDGNEHEFGVIEAYKGQATSTRLRAGLGTINIKLSAKSTFSGIVPVIVEN